MSIQPQNLTHADDRDPGIRRRAGKGGFSYVDIAGRPVKDEETLARIKALAIPPAWTDVWICPDPFGHIQATGRDKRGRKQYRYHAGWRAFRDQAKYERLAAFGARLPRLRRRIDEDLSRRGLPREKVLAGVCRLLEVTRIRVGNEEYARDNKSYGLTTLKKRHVALSGSGAVFEFKGKSGVSHRTGFRDARLARLVRACADLPGQRLFQYVDEDGVRHAVGSAEVNAYIREAMGEAFSAKDFRTWSGTVAALELLAGGGDVRETVKAVARLLGNTPTVCRACYIHPAVIAAAQEGRLKVRGDPERALLRLLRDMAKRLTSSTV